MTVPRIGVVVRRMAVLALVEAVVVLSAGPFGSAGTAIATPFGCTEPVTNVWAKVPSPGGLAAIGQRDGNPCALLAVNDSGRLVSSSDGGGHWRSGEATRLLTVFTESMGIRQSDGGQDDRLVIATATAGTDAAQSNVPLVEVSHDGGLTFDAVQLAVSGPTGAPFYAQVLSTAAAKTFVNGKPQTTVYLVGSTAPLGSATETVAKSAQLYVSTDGGATFSRATGDVTQDTEATVLSKLENTTNTASVTPDVVAVNPTSPTEVWINDTHAGGVWVSEDGGQSFTQACCGSDAPIVTAITVTPTSAGYVQVLLATDHGLRRSVDDGTTWAPVYDGALTGVRTAPDSASAILVTTADKVLLSTSDPSTPKFRALPGLPSGCHPSRLRRDAVLPPVFLVDCSAGSTYRLTLSSYGGSITSNGGGGSGGGSSGGLITFGNSARPLQMLATWALPDWNSASGAIAFSGTALYYDRNKPGQIGAIDAATGRYIGAFDSGVAMYSMSFDLRRNQLFLTSYDSSIYIYDLLARKMSRLGPAPYGVPSYDSSTDGFSWVPEYQPTLNRATRTGGPASAHTVCSTTLGGLTSTYVAGGDGGGYIQSEDDSTIYRIDAKCAIKGTYAHRPFNESGAENDALACDTQTFFPQAAVWIRDSTPGTVTAYAVPFGYCPMPSSLSASATPEVLTGTTGRVCARLINETTKLPAAGRPITLSVNGAQIGHTMTDATGTGCLPYLAPSVIPAARVVYPVHASFTGDAALYPSTSGSSLAVVGTPVAPPPVQHQVALAVPPVPPVVPPAPIPNPGPMPVSQPAPAPNPAPAGQAQAQSQPIAQGVVVPQKQTQPQLVFARAVNTVAQELGAEAPMSALPASQRHAPLAPITLLAGAGLTAVAGCARVLSRRIQPAPARRRDEPEKRQQR